MRQITQVFQRFGNLPFIGILLFIELFFWTNGKAIFPNWESTYGQLIEIYMVMTLVFLFISLRRKKIGKQIDTPLWKAGIGFAVGFIFTWILLEAIVISGLLTVPESFNMDLFWQTILIQVCVVACAEEIMFRGVILITLEDVFKNPLIAIVGSSLVFAFWHLYAYNIVLYDESVWGANWSSVFIAFAIGLVLAVVARDKRLGLSACIGIHACYNLIIVGVLAV